MKYFLSSRRGSVLIEAALVMPLLVLILFTLAEFGEAFTIKRRNAQIASTAADLVSQVSCVSASQTGTPSSLQDIATIASIIMQPYSYSGSIAGISVTSVAQTGGNALIQWSWATGTLTPGTAGGSFSMPPGLFNPCRS
jgi:Flp pilus assembly protein TadG